MDPPSLDQVETPNLTNPLQVYHHNGHRVCSLSQLILPFLAALVPMMLKVSERDSVQSLCSFFDDVRSGLDCMIQIHENAVAQKKCFLLLPHLILEIYLLMLQLI